MKLLHSLLAVALLVGLVSWVGADDEAKNEGKGKKKATAGVVEKIDGDGKAITIKTGKKNDPNATTVTIAFSDATKFVLRDADGEKDAKASDVAVGKRVQIVKATKDGKEVATTVTIVAGKKKK